MKSIKTLITAAGIAALSTMAQAELIYPTQPIVSQTLSPVNQASLAAVADGVSTLGALANGAVEKNPLLPSSPVGIIATTAMKVGLTRWADTLPDEQRATFLTSFRSFFGGAAVNNLLVLASAANPVAMLGGILTGGYLWQDSKKTFEAEAVAKAEARKAQALAQAQPNNAPASSFNFAARQVPTIIASASPFTRQ